MPTNKISSYKQEQEVSELRIELKQEQNKHQSAQNTSKGLEQSLEILKSESVNWQSKEQEAEQKTQDSLSKMSISTTNPPPKGVKRVLLHSCCAPCSGAMVEEMCSSKYIEDVVVFFYNPNIHPKREYEIRKVCMILHITLY